MTSACRHVEWLWSGLKLDPFLSLKQWVYHQSLFLSLVYLLQSALFSSTTCDGKEDKSSVVPSTAALMYEMALWASRT